MVVTKLLSMKTTDVSINDKRLCIEVCDVWDFTRDIHLFQSNVVDKAAMQRYIVGKYKNSEEAEQKAREWIDRTYK